MKKRFMKEGYSGQYDFGVLKLDKEKAKKVTIKELVEMLKAINS